MNATVRKESSLELPIPLAEPVERLRASSKSEEPQQQGGRIRTDTNECESDNKMGIFRRVSRATPYDIASLAVSCVSTNHNFATTSSSTPMEIPDPDGGDCCRSLMELSRWINPSRTTKAEKSGRQHLNKRKAQRFDIAFLTRPSTEEDSSTGSCSRSDSQSPELDVVALDSSCKSEEDNENPKQRASRSLAVVRGSKRQKTTETNASRFINQNIVEDLTYSKLRSDALRNETPSDQSVLGDATRSEETVSAFKKVDRCSPSSTSNHQRLGKISLQSSLLSSNNQTRILLPNTSVVNGGLRPSLDAVLSGGSVFEPTNKNVQYQDASSMMYKTRFPIPDSASLINVPSAPVDLGMSLPNFPKSDTSFPVTVSSNPRRGSSTSLQHCSTESNETAASSSSSSYATKSYAHPLLPFLPPSLAALTFPTQNWCAKCNASFRMTSDLVYHMRSHHKRETDVQKKKREEKLRCDICHESFRERHHLTRHMTSHQ